jgi:hypothetical protein
MAFSGKLSGKLLKSLLFVLVNNAVPRLSFKFGVVGILCRARRENTKISTGKVFNP